MKKGIKILLIIVASLVVLLLGTVIILPKVVGTTYTVDSSLISKNNDYSVKVLDKDGYVTLNKTYKNSDDTFKILSFTDMHLDTYKECGDISLNMMIRNIVREKPDFVVLLGDCITSAFNSSRANQLAKVFEDLGVYWTYTLGNHEHDNFFSVTRARLLKIFAKYDHYVEGTIAYKTSDNERVVGNGNHVINILGEDGNVSQSLYFFDGFQDMTKKDMKKYKNEIESIGHETNEVGDTYDYIKNSQIKWYKETVNDINLKYGAVKSTIFVHIPLVQSLNAYKAITNEGNDAMPFNDISSIYQESGNIVGKDYSFDDINNNSIIYGKRRETIWCSGHDSGLFDVIKELGSTQAVFSGHDHVNDFVLKYDGIVLGYVTASGYSSYNCLSKKGKDSDGENSGKSYEDHLIKGYTVFNIKNDGSMSFRSEQNWYLYSELNDTILETKGFRK